MDIVILDLEWNAAYSRRSKRYLNEIIEFGAVKCGEDLAVKGEFSSLVKPRLGREMNPYTADLTRLSIQELAGGAPFPKVVSQFRRWAGDCLLLTWSSSDVRTLVENCRYFMGQERVPFLTRYADLQRYAQERLGAEAGEQLGLAAAAERLGLDVSQMAHHRALDDSRMALAILRRLYDRDQLLAQSSVCDGEFYRRATFKTRIITDPSDPMVSAEDLAFPCPRCGGATRRISHWTPHNRSSRAVFRCGSCGHSFGGRLTIKEKYEGITVTKKSLPLPVVEPPRQAAPGPLGAARIQAAQGVGVLRFPSLEGLGVNAAFSTRAGGVSEGDFAAMNLAFGRGDADENVARNFRLFCQAAGFDPESLVTGAQDHHTNVRRVTAGQRGIGVWRPKDQESVDGLCTDDPAVTLVVYCADCVPLYFADPARQAIGLAHAGWRGTAAGMARVMTQRMAEEFGSDPADLRVVIGPSICRECFEVDRPVAEVFLALPQAERFVTGPAVNPLGEEKYHVDLWECNRQFLLAAGVPAERVSVAGVCTMEESDLLFSHRKTQGRRGGNCAFLALGNRG